MSEFPIDWNEWTAEWREWHRAHAARMARTAHRFGPKNFLADDVLGSWDVNGRAVELSEVTMPDFGVRPERRVRFIGVTFGTGNGPETALVASWDELETALGI